MAEKPTVILTGASRGIGRAIAIQLSLNDKYKLCLLSRDLNGLNETKKLCQAIKPETFVKCFQCDVSIPTELQSILLDVCNNYGPLHVLINNAGVGDSGNSLNADFNHWDKMLNVNLRSVTQSTAICLPYLKKSAVTNDNVTIINISSVAGTLRVQSPGMSMYSATKYAVFGFSESVFQDVKDYGIKVSCIMPGFVDTEMVRKLKKRDTLEFKNMMRASDIAQSVQYVLNCSRYCCPNQIVLRAQRNPIKANL
eukprot:411483_1